MALASNQRFQMAARLQADIKLLNPALSAKADLINGDPAIDVMNGATKVAMILIKRRDFNGFNLVAELSPSSANGLPEHECWLDMLSSLSMDQVALLVKAASAIGASSLKIVSSAAPAAADMIDANVLIELPNDSRVGASGN